MRQLVWVDLCSGLGGASQPALDRGWEVIRVDIEPKFKPDIVADVRALPLKPFPIDVLWASPPCTEYSRWSMPCWYARDKEPDHSLMEAARKAVGYFKPRYWIIENTRGAKKFMRGILGPHAVETGGHVFWGKLPGLIPQCKSHKDSWTSRGTAVRDPAKRALVPYEIGEAVCRAVEAKQKEGGK